MKKNGFSLIELLVVIGIIAVLTALSVFNFNQARMRARDVQRKNDVKAFQEAMELYRLDNSQFPADEADLVPTYLKSTLTDPKEALTNGSWADYAYTQTSATTYTFSVCLESTSDPLATGAACGSNSSGKLYTVTEP